MKDMRHTLLRIWLIIWVVTLPLVHIHPEADHAHGMPGHVHGGTYHTVLSGTPICAYQDHQHHHDSFSSGETFGLTHAPLHQSHGFEHSTYGFSVLNSLIDLQLEESEILNDGVVIYALGVPGVSLPDISTRKSLTSILPKTHSPRAPPVLTV